MMSETLEVYSRTGRSFWLSADPSLIAGGCDGAAFFCSTDGSSSDLRIDVALLSFKPPFFPINLNLELEFVPNLRLLVI
jgi:hypothetical protein